MDISVRTFLKDLHNERDRKQDLYDEMIRMYQQAVAAQDDNTAAVYEHQARVLINDVRRIDTTIELINERVGG